MILLCHLKLGRNLCLSGYEELYGLLTVTLVLLRRFKTHNLNERRPTFDIQGELYYPCFYFGKMSCSSKLRKNIVRNKKHVKSVFIFG